MPTIQPFDFSVNLLQAILWQYNEAANLQALLQNKNAWYEENQRGFWEDWIRDVYDLRTANDFGLQVWSIILQQPIVVSSAANPTRPTWGFGAAHKNFTRGNFGDTTGSTYRLSTESARILLQLRYFQITSSGTVPEINRMLKYVFKDYGVCWLNDNHDMRQLYTFTFPLPSDLVFVFNNFDVLPRPAGVESEYIVLVTPAWGFGIHHENFNNGNFSEL